MHNNLIKTCKYSILIFQTRYQTNDIDVKTDALPLSASQFHITLQ